MFVVEQKGHKLIPEPISNAVECPRAKRRVMNQFECGLDAVHGKSSRWFMNEKDRDLDGVRFPGRADRS